MLDVQKFVGDLQEYIQRAVSPIATRLKALEDREPVMVKGEPGQNGKDGINGRDGEPATDEQVSVAVERYLKANPPPKGEKGESGPAGANGVDGAAGRDGKDGVDGKHGLQGEKGLPGADGRDAEVDYADIVKAVEEAHERLVAKYVLDLERRGSDAIQRALEKLHQPKDGKDGRDGKDGLSVEGLQREYVPESHEIREVWTAAGQQKELRYPAGGINAKGYWREGIKAKAGDAWTEAGALWIALKETTDKPGITSKDWVLGARAGRDGSHGRNGKDAQPVQLKAANGA